MSNRGEEERETYSGRITKKEQRETYSGHIMNNERISKSTV